MSRRFRKVFIVTEDNRIFPRSITTNSVYLQQARAEDFAVRRTRENLAQAEKLWVKKDPIITYKVEGFYLVHESLFEEVIKPHTE